MTTTNKTPIMKALQDESPAGQPAGAAGEQTRPQRRIFGTVSHGGNMSKDREFFNHLTLIDAQIKAGEIKQMLVERRAEEGRVILVETDQGWNPEPFYVEFPIECWSYSE